MFFRLLGAAALALSSVSVPAGAAVVFAFEEVGGDVVGTLSGSIDLTGLTVTDGGGLSGNDFIVPSSGRIVATSDAGANPNRYEFTASGGAFGSGGQTNGTYSGDNFLVNFGAVYLRPDYVSGAALSGVLTFAGSTFATLGITPGSYVSTLPNDETVTITVAVAAAVPVPATALLLGGALVVGGASLRRARRGRGSALRSA